ncbi:Ulp1-like peptidase [Cucumis melo var. makuwa]|uniref:Ulp1-like peptidase n=1 Tax=Cucumis melo var. makuwa TaxID=1194695 RepID=A0A5A7U2T7_CUCMM|nr:Ulp1-like peptidase [Cucumis melo var. makuwa]TYK02383.1 Ulp1-like peptidase [Cucumis melo var. makuwa]
MDTRRPVGDFKKKPRWEDVNYVIDCINIKEYWLAVAADMRKCKMYVFDSMPNYVDKKLVDQALEMPARCIASLAIAIGVDLHSKQFRYGPWPKKQRETLTLTLQPAVAVAAVSPNRSAALGASSSLFEVAPLHCRQNVRDRQPSCEAPSCRITEQQPSSIVSRTSSAVRDRQAIFVEAVESSLGVNHKQPKPVRPQLDLCESARASCQHGSKPHTAPAESRLPFASRAYLPTEPPSFL